MREKKKFQIYEERLFARVDRSIISLKNNGGEYDLGNLSPYDRKKVHSYVVKNHKDIVSKSRGEGKNRRLFLFLKKDKKSEKKYIPQKLTIDIYGDDI